VTREATRPLMIEVQALVDQAGGNPKRVSVGLEQNRLALQLQCYINMVVWPHTIKMFLLMWLVVLR